MKETTLILINLLLLTINNQQDQIDILYWMNILIRKNEKVVSFIDDLYGSDYRIIEKVSKQFHLFLRTIKDQLVKEKTFNPKHFALIQSLIWKIKGRDYNFLNDQAFFEIFEKLTEYHSHFEINNSVYGFEKYNSFSLDSQYFDLFQIYSLQIFKRASQSKLDDLLQSSSLIGLKRNQSKIDESDLQKVMVIILDKFKNEIEIFNKLNIKFKKDPFMNQKYNDEKFNSYLVLFLRIIASSKDIILFTISTHNNLVSLLLEAFLISSDKNKTIIIKIINCLISVSETYFSIESFKSSLKLNFKKLYESLCLKEEVKIYNLRIIKQKNISS